jgi:hypothetical protein
MVKDRGYCLFCLNKVKEDKQLKLIEFWWKLFENRMKLHSVVTDRCMALAFSDYPKADLLEHEFESQICQGKFVFNQIVELIMEHERDRFISQISSEKCNQFDVLWFEACDAIKNHNLTRWREIEPQLKAIMQARIP